MCMIHSESEGMIELHCTTREHYLKSNMTGYVKTGIMTLLRHITQSVGKL